MRPIATDVARSVVCVSVCLCVGYFDVLSKKGPTHVYAKKHVLDGGGGQDRKKPLTAVRGDRSAIWSQGCVM